MSFWEKLQKPFFVMAPMADVTDPAFRRIIAKYSAHMRLDGSRGGPDVMWTEFVSADGLARAPEEGQRKLRADLQYDESERPIVAQLFSSNPEYMESAARLCREMGFDGVDINMGCPDASIEKQGAGAAHIKNPERAVEVIQAAQKGAGSFEGGIPVSVKTRLGYNTDILEEWLPKIIATDVAAVTVHARTRKEMSKVPARWECVERAVVIRDALGVSTRIIGNGDALSLSDARAKALYSGADGVMLGRAIFGNPWLFVDHIPTQEERLLVMLEHTRLYEKLLPHKSFAIMKKHFKSYVAGFDEAGQLRAKLMDACSSADIEIVVENFLHTQ